MVSPGHLEHMGTRWCSTHSPAGRWANTSTAPHTALMAGDMPAQHPQATPADRDMPPQTGPHSHIYPSLSHANKALQRAAPTG